MSYEVAEVLENAAEVLEQKGWVQGHLGDERQGYCAMGAISRALEGDRFVSLWPESKTALIESLGLPEPTPAAVHPIPAWNDAPERTKQEVIDAFHAAAKQEKRKADGIL